MKSLRPLQTHHRGNVVAQRPPFCPERDTLKGGHMMHETLVRQRDMLQLLHPGGHRIFWGLHDSGPPCASAPPGARKRFTPVFSKAGNALFGGLFSGKLRAATIPGRPKAWCRFAWRHAFLGCRRGLFRPWLQLGPDGLMRYPLFLQFQRIHRCTLHLPGAAAPASAHAPCCSSRCRCPLPSASPASIAACAALLPVIATVRHRCPR